ncbi:MAG: DEAD/DEAH box helicase family protein [Patescibacteria group bacterium]
MALHPDFPKDPYVILDPDVRWFPADEVLRQDGYEKLLPPLVPRMRKLVKEWRENGYAGASETTRALLRWWFIEEHASWDASGEKKFRYYFAQREAVETAVYLAEIAGIHEPVDLLHYDGTGRLSTGMFVEDWPRLALKLATGTGKTKVISLLIAWSYFHRRYETSSPFSKNFLLITPNIIVLDRIKNDFAGCKTFFDDPILPDNGYMGQLWRDDFQVVVHLQDEVGTVSSDGNIFLTNIHRVYQSDVGEASFADEDVSSYFLGAKPVGKTNESKVDLGDIVRNVDELMVLNDEAHHIGDESVWLKSIQDISNQLKLKGKRLSMQIDLTATPKNEKGRLFPQVVCDYPLVEAMHQNVVKHPILPDHASRAKLIEKQTSKFVEKYSDFLDLGYLEWKKSHEEHQKAGKKAILFVMTDDTTNCDDVAAHLEEKYPEYRDRVLTIHTNKSGEISESSGKKDKEELEKLRKLSNEIDKPESPYLAIVSVMMLKEGWDVRNVTTIVGLRPFASKSNILPEQTLGRGLRLMYFGQGVEEYVSVIGTPAFMDFVESIKSEGVTIETRKMDRESRAVAPIIVEVDTENEKKNKETLDIELPDLTPRIAREFKNLSELSLDDLTCKPVEFKPFTKEQTREIVFKKIGTGEVDHVTKLDAEGLIDYQSVIGFFTNGILRELRLVGGYDQLFPLIKEFVRLRLFGREVVLEDPVTIRNLSEPDACRTLDESVKKAINNLTVVDRGEAEIRNYIRLSQTKPFVVNDQAFLVPKKSIFNRVVGDSRFELEVASFLEDCDDIIAFAKNNLAIGFKIDYQKADGSIANYFPDFFIKADAKTVYILETKGREDLDDSLKIARLKQWCADATKQQDRFEYRALYVKEEDWEKYKPKDFAQLAKTYSF